MNKHILFSLDHQVNPLKYTEEDLTSNRSDSYATHRATESPVDYIAYRAACAYSSHVGHWLTIYFTRTGEDKQTYIDAIS
jgi:hypothetical protein